MNEDRLVALRRAFAQQVLASVGVSDARLEDAFARVERERYLGPGPWQIVRASGYEPTPDADSAHLYADLLVGIIPERRLNNGMPSYHAHLMAHAAVQPGEHVVHIGAGVGYYTAILAELVGPAGRVSAVEYDADLAQRAAANLAALPNVRVLQGDGFAMAFDAADVIYVNAGTTGPAETWLDSLRDGGRLILPLTARRVTPVDSKVPLSCHGAVFRITRDGEAFGATWLSAVGVYPCEGGRDDEAERALDTALRHGGFKDVKRLYRTGKLPADQCWLRSSVWSLAYQ
jgi:protein-L-isoaspartate(D-aspartate) O-methyltransferase